MSRKSPRAGEDVGVWVQHTSQVAFPSDFIAQTVFQGSPVKKCSTPMVCLGWDPTGEVSSSPGAFGAWYLAMNKVLC